MTFTLADRVHERVILHIDGIHDHHTADLHRMVRDGDGWSTTVDVPDDLVSSYRVVPLDAAAAARFDATDDSRARWRGLMDSLVPHELDHPGWRPPLAGTGASGRLVMPGAPELPGWDERDPVDWQQATPAGRRLWTSGLEGAESLLVISDGENWARTSLPAALVRLHDQGRLPRTGVVAVDTSEDRISLLSRSQRYRDLIAGSVLPWARQFADVPAERTVISGESLGGLSAVDLVLARPDVARLVVSTSGSFWFPDWTDADPGGEVAAQIRASGAPDGIRVHLSAGRGEGRMVDHSTAVADQLRAAGVPVTLDIGTHGHEMAGWTGALTRGLVVVSGSTR